VDGGQVGATQATVSDVEHARSLATPSMGCATARARAAVPPARLAAESAQETPEEQSPAQARRQSPRVGRASLCGQFGRRAMQTSPEAPRCAAADSGGSGAELTALAEAERVKSCAHPTRSSRP
jgi:hypothetical protein